MNKNKLADEIEELRQTYREDEWWDFKREHHHDKAELVHDIICMANNRANRDSYIIFGVENDTLDVVGVENDTHRRNQQGVVNILRNIRFAGGVRPRIEMYTILIENHEIDVLVIKDTSNTPYYLEKEYQDSSLKLPDGRKYGKIVHPFHIYTRVVDNNTAIDSNADINDIEYLWRKRFGYDLSPSKRLAILLTDYKNWSVADWDTCRHSFHTESPEYQIIAADACNCYESISYFYDDETMLAAEVSINYLTTTLYTTQFWYMDNGRCIIPKLNQCYLTGKGYYFYICKDSIEGKLLGLLTQGKYHFHNRSGVDMPILLFETETDSMDFKNYFLSYNDGKKRKLQRAISNDAIMQHIVSKENRNGAPEYGAKDIALAYTIYKYWKKEKFDV